MGWGGERKNITLPISFPPIFHCCDWVHHIRFTTVAAAVQVHSRPSQISSLVGTHHGRALFARFLQSAPRRHRRRGNSAKAGVVYLGLGAF